MVNTATMVIWNEMKMYLYSLSYYHNEWLSILYDITYSCKVGILN